VGGETDGEAEEEHERSRGSTTETRQCRSGR